MTNRQLTIGSTVLLIIALIVIIWMATSPSPAHAGSRDHYALDWGWEEPRARPRRARAPRKYRHTRQRDYDEPRSYRAPPWREIEIVGDGIRRPICVPEIVEAIGSEHTTEETSMGAARKQWEWTTQWKWGSDYMALELAEDFRHRCGKSAAMDTFTGKLNEAVSTVVGKEGFNQRCIIRARPCRALLEGEGVERYR